MFAEQNVVDLTAEHVRAMDVLEEQIGNAASKDFIEKLNEQAEETHRRAFVLPWEEREDGSYAKSYVTRAMQWRAANKKDPRQQLAMSMAPDLAEVELEKYARMSLSTLREVTEVKEIVGGQETIVKRQFHVERINELRAVLGKKPIDLNAFAAKIDAPDYEAKAAEFLKLSRGERVRQVVEINDRTLLGYIAADDPEQEIRTIAQRRLLNLATEG